MYKLIVSTLFDPLRKKRKTGKWALIIANKYCYEKEKDKSFPSLYNLKNNRVEEVRKWGKGTIKFNVVLSVVLYS